MWFKNLSLRQRICVVGTITYIIGFLLLLIAHPGSKDTFETVFDIGMIVPHCFAAYCCFVYVRKGQHSAPIRRLGWFLIGLSVISYLAGDIIWCIYTSQPGGQVPYPSWADAAFLAVFPFLICGVLLLFGSVPNAGRIRLLLDSAIAASSIGMLSWYFLVRHLWQVSGMSLFGKLVNIAYPLGDIAALFSALVLLNSHFANRSLRNSLMLLAGGIISWSFADTLYIYTRFHKVYHIGAGFEWGWPFGALMMGYACLLPLWAKQDLSAKEETSLDKQAAGSSGILRLLAPYIAAGAALLTVVGYDYGEDGKIGNGTLLVGFGMLALVMLRQVFTLWENRYLTTQVSAQLLENQALTGQLRAMNDGLEQRVAQRTQQLSGLLELTKAVNSTLQVQDVLVAAIEHTQQALQAEAVMLWLLPSEDSENNQLCHLPMHRGLEDHTEVYSFLARQKPTEETELLPLPTNLPGLRNRSGICMRVPLLWHQRLLGMIGVIRWNTQVELTEWEMLQSIGLELGTAIENARQHHAALEAADKDPVTGLFNHRAIHHHLDRAMERARKQDGSLAVIMMDLNNFKLFNDTYGHPVGDQVLKSVAQALNDICRVNDYAGRYGGDEFLIVLPDAAIEEAMSLAERLRERMLCQGFRRAEEDRVVPVTLSFGIATFPNDSANRHELLTIADTNLYKAKQSEDGIRATTSAQQANRQLRSEGSFDLLDAMVAAVDNKDQYTRHHSEDVTEYALWTAEELGVSEATLRLIRIGGLLHDVGKIGVPDEILRKPGRLTPEEYEVMKRHPRLGALIVGAVPGMEGIVDAVRSHHERWDGNGYPDATAGEDTPFLGRLLAVADAFSAMTTDRPYRKGMDWAVALAEIEANIGTQFDPVMARAFLSAAKKRRPQLIAPSQSETASLQTETLRRAA